MKIKTRQFLATLFATIGIGMTVGVIRITRIGWVEWILMIGTGLYFLEFFSYLLGIHCYWSIAQTPRHRLVAMLSVFWAMFTAGVMIMLEENPALMLLTGAGNIWGGLLITHILAPDWIQRVRQYRSLSRK